MIERAHPEGTMYIGFIVGAAGLGMAAGSYLTDRLFAGLDRGRIVSMWIPVVILPLAVLALTRNLLLAAFAVGVAGFAGGPVFVSSETAVQEQAPPRRQATVFALRDALMKVAILIAAWLAGSASTVIGDRLALGVLLLAWLALWSILRSTTR
jgi:MFS family permease